MGAKRHNENEILTFLNNRTIHYRMDVRRLIDGHEKWDLMIAHPPCTYLTNAGARWLVDNPARKKQMQLAAEFFNTLLTAPIPRICVENPIMHGHARKLIKQQYAQIIHPMPRQRRRVSG